MAGNIYHEWNGTVLTITSDSGTSSADLKGAKGDMGVRGTQGVAGRTPTDTINAISRELQAHETAINPHGITCEDINAMPANTEIPSIEGLATETYVNNATNDMATKTYVRNIAGTLQPKLGFTPVKQGGGEGMAANTVAIGWNGVDKLLAQVDTVELGPLATEGFVNNIAARAKDYVIQQGTSGDWYYRKWNSGYAEMFGKVAGTSDASGYLALAYPFPIKTLGCFFIENSRLTGSGRKPVTIGSMGYNQADFYTVSTTDCSVVAPNARYEARLYITGTWI